LCRLPADTRVAVGDTVMLKIVEDKIVLLKD
jgi:hypothetical protein